ncbi:MAG TPA: hypothetical protein VN577_10200 [Terriglobales bacterium]|nr:hypothetical protein [Terriglobales bacterium]
MKRATNDPLYAQYIRRNADWFKQQFGKLAATRPDIWVCKDNVARISEVVYELWLMHDGDWLPDWQEFSEIANLLGPELTPYPHAYVRPSRFKPGASLKFPRDDFYEFAMRLWRQTPYEPWGDIRKTRLP